MEQTKALNALEPFLALTKSATSARAAADLVSRATSAPNTFVFAELLQAPQIQALRESADHSPYLTHLEIFSHGTYADYSASSNLPALNDQQTLKLRQLSLLTLAKNPPNLSYAALQKSLGLPSARALEDLVISAIYAELLSAQLDPFNQTVHVSSVSPLRDLAPNSIPGMLSTLKNWSDRCTTTLADLETQINAIKASAAARHQEKNAQAARTESLIRQEKDEKLGVHTRGQTNMITRAVANIRSGGRYKRGSNSLEAGWDDDEAMDLDDNDYEDEGGEGSSAGGSAAGGKKRASRRKL